jgi:predicted acetyltransferase
MAFELVKPALEYLPAYQAALERGWSPSNIDEERTIARELAAIARDPEAFVASLDDPLGEGEPITLPDGQVVPRLPGFRRWMWDGELAGTIGLRWRKGSAELPPHVLGHIGYTVVPWKRRRGYATEALRMMLDEARARAFPWVYITANLDNAVSHKVIRANGGVETGRFIEDAAYGGKESLRFRIMLAAPRRE